MDCWKDTAYLNMEVPYKGNYATYLLGEEEFLMNDKAGTYKIIKNLTSTSTLTITISEFTELLDKNHMDFTCKLYYKIPKKINNVSYQPSDNPEVPEDYRPETPPDMPYQNIDNSEIPEKPRTTIKSPVVEEDFESMILPCELNDNKIIISLWNPETNKARLPITSIFSEKIELNLLLNKKPWIDIYNGNANDPYEILVNSEEQLEQIIYNAPDDGSLTIIRLDSNRKPYSIPETLVISTGQNIEIRGGTGQFIANSKVQKGNAVLDGTLCKRTFIVQFGAKLSLQYLTLQNNNSTPYGTYDRGRGGAILVEAIRRDNGVMKYGVLNCTNCTFSNNKAYHGGAIFSYHAGLFLDTCDFLDNSVTNHGGAVYYWARDTRLKFDNITIMNGENIILKVKITDYFGNLVDEGVVDFYLKTDKGETHKGSIDVSNYVRVDEEYELASVPNKGTVKRIRTEPEDERRFDIVIKNNLPVTVRKDGKTLLKSPYDDKYNNIELADGEKKVIAIFKQNIGTALVPTVKSEDGKTYVDYTKPEALKFLVYLKEKVGYLNIPSDSSVKYVTTNNEEELHEVILKDGLPVTVMDNGVQKLKSTYNNKFNPITLSTGESLRSIVFKKKLIDEETEEEEEIPMITNPSDGKKYLDFSNQNLMKFIVYNQEIDESKTSKGWATLTIPTEGNTKTKLVFVAHYKGGATYEDEVASNVVTVIIPETYTSKFNGEVKGSPGDQVTVSVEVTDSKKAVITKPKGKFTLGGNEYVAQVEGGYYYIKYQIPKNAEIKDIPVSFSLEDSIYYKWKIVSDVIHVVEEGKEVSYKPTISVPITGLYVDSIKVTETTKGVYVDQGITDNLVSTWITAGVTDLFVKCIDYDNAKHSATLKSVVDKVGSKMRIHAVIECFCDTTVDTKGKDYMVSMWGTVNPASIARKNVVTKNINSILANREIDGICLDYVRYNGDKKNNAWNGNVAENNRKAHVNEALKSFKTTITATKPSCIITATYMPETDSETLYGQKLLDMKGYVDYIIPLCFKGNYATESNDGDNWIVGKLKEYIKIITADNLLCAIHTFKSDADLETAKEKGKESTAFRSKSNLDTTINAIAQTKVKGNILYHNNAISKDSGGKLQYPQSYKNARDKYVD